jgi:hypothetical protein
LLPSKRQLQRGASYKILGKPLMISPFLPKNPDKALLRPFAAVAIPNTAISLVFNEKHLTSTANRQL